MSYLKYFGLSENPFEETNDEKYYYESQSLKEAFARLNLFTKSSGIFHLYGKYGVGKTMLLKKLINQLSGNCQPVLINYTALESYCFLLQLSKALGLPDRNNTTNLVAQIQEHINNSNQHIILIIDEAQDLHYGTLETLKLIAGPNIHTNRFKLIISSLPEMKNKISSLPSLKQRITLYYRLRPLDLTESREYIRFRLKTANCAETLFEKTAIEKIIEMAEGLPRDINKLSNLSLIAAAAQNKKVVDLNIIETISAELSLYQG